MLAAEIEKEIVETCPGAKIINIFPSYVTQNKRTK